MKLSNIKLICTCRWRSNSASRSACSRANLLRSAKAAFASSSVVILIFAIIEAVKWIINKNRHPPLNHSQELVINSFDLDKISLIIPDMSTCSSASPSSLTSVISGDFFSCLFSSFLATLGDSSTIASDRFSCIKLVSSLTCLLAETGSVAIFVSLVMDSTTFSSCC